MFSPSHLHFCSLLLPFLILPLLPTVFTFSQKDCQKWPQSRVLAQNNPFIFKSHSNEFALGFHPILKGNEILFLLAVWFNNIGECIDERTIVWSANGNKLAPLSSEFMLSGNGEYVLHDQNGKELWSAPTNGTKSACVAILDNGNFVILDKNYSPIWESFKNPTDTILPGQILDVPSFLRARNSTTDYTDGHFQLRMWTDGIVGLYPAHLSDEDSRGPYWETLTLFLEGLSPLIFHEDGKIYIDDGRSTSTSQRLHSMKDHSNQTFYYLARIDHDGVFRLYKHRKKKSITHDGSCRLSWTIVQEIPDNICGPMPGYDYGYGFGTGWCGYNSICEKKSSVVVCSCPHQYYPLDSSDPSRGCKPDFPSPSCQTNGWESNKELVDFEELHNIDWPASDYNFWSGPKMDNATCKKKCLEDCLCAAATYDHETKLCWMKRQPLSNGIKSSAYHTTAFLKVPKGKSKWKKHHSTMVLVMALLLGSSGFLNILLLVVVSAALFYINRKRKNPVDIANTSTMSVRRYTYKELDKATGRFTQTLGRGAFGKVYKGFLPSNPRRFVAVKMLDKVAGEGEKEFKTEVSVICQTHHKNLVRLLGYCDEDEHRLLVYEYMSNGSLATFLFGISRPHWNQRVQIILGIARGLMYLHEECNTQIIHCDIKPQNILLDENFTPRISDFGLAKLLLADQSKIQTQRRGTIGYFAPEWFKKALISVKVDIYSFGVMLLEIICCKSSVSFAMGNQEEALIDWAYKCYKEKRLEKMVENDEEARNDMERVERLVITAIWCIQEDPSLRPTMKKVTQMLEGVVGVYVPPRPSLFVSPPLLITPFERL